MVLQEIAEKLQHITDAGFSCAVIRIMRAGDFSLQLERNRQKQTHIKALEKVFWR
jgi:hypothetical protein